MTPVFLTAFVVPEEHLSRQNDVYVSSVYNSSQSFKYSRFHARLMGFPMEMGK